MFEKSANAKRSLGRLYLVIPPYYLTYRLWRLSKSLSLYQQLWSLVLTGIMMGFMIYSIKLAFELLDELGFKKEVGEESTFLQMVYAILVMLAAASTPILLDWLLLEAEIVDDIVFYEPW